MVIWTDWEAKFSKMKAVFFLINSLCGLKANGPFPAKSCPGPLWKIKFAILALERAILKPKFAIFKLKVKPKLASLKLKVTLLTPKWSFGRFGRPKFPK